MPRLAPDQRSVLTLRASSLKLDDRTLQSHYYFAASDAETNAVPLLLSPRSLHKKSDRSPSTTFPRGSSSHYTTNATISSGTRSLLFRRSGSFAGHLDKFMNNHTISKISNNSNFNNKTTRNNHRLRNWQRSWSQPSDQEDLMVLPRYSNHGATTTTTHGSPTTTSPTTIGRRTNHHSNPNSNSVHEHHHHVIDDLEHNHLLHSHHTSDHETEEDSLDCSKYEKEFKERISVKKGKIVTHNMLHKCATTTHTTTTTTTTRGGRLHKLLCCCVILGVGGLCISISLMTNRSSSSSSFEVGSTSSRVSIPQGMSNQTQPQPQDHNEHYSHEMDKLNVQQQQPSVSSLRTTKAKLRREFASKLVAHGVTTAERLEDPFSPAAAALHWVVDAQAAAAAATGATSTVTTTTPTTVTDHDISTKFALATLFYSTHTMGSQWLQGESSWLQLPHVCDWYGIQCAHKARAPPTNNKQQLTDIVTSIHLANNQLQGTLPEELFWGLQHDLIDLDLSHNQLWGPLPHHIILESGTAQNKNNNNNNSVLQKLQLHHNALTGAVPANLQEAVKELSLSNNHFDTDDDINNQ